jgi:hypothetical protein
MNTPWWGQDEEWRGVIRRAVEEFCRRASEFFPGTEEYVYAFDADGLGVWIGIKSINAVSLFDVIHRSVFSGFAPEGRWTDDGGMEWRHFGYSQPSTRPEKVGGVIRLVEAA